MKKVTRVLGLVCMAGLLACTTSCKKQNDTASTVVNMPQMQVVNWESGDRAYINEDVEFMWEDDDEICVYNLAADPMESVMSVFSNVTGEGYMATFSGPEVGDPKDYQYFYFYPTNMVDMETSEEQLAEDNSQTFVVEPVQYFKAYYTQNHPINLVDSKQMPMAINTDDLHKTVYLKHIFGIAQITLKAKKNVEKHLLRLTIEDNTFNLFGEARLCLHKVNTETLQDLMDKYINEDPNFATDLALYLQDLGYRPNGQGKTIMMDCTQNPDGWVALAQTPNKTEFNFMLRPMVLSTGFKLTAEFEDGEVKIIDSWQNHPECREFAMEPGVIKCFNYTKAFDVWPRN